MIWIRGTFSLGWLAFCAYVLSTDVLPVLGWRIGAILFVLILNSELQEWVAYLKRRERQALDALVRTHAIS